MGLSNILILIGNGTLEEKQTEICGDLPEAPHPEAQFTLLMYLTAMALEG